jgi:hypothetical protein
MPLWQGRNLRPIKSVTESGAEQTVVDRATNLKQQICAISRQSHLLRVRAVSDHVEAYPVLAR